MANYIISRGKLDALSSKVKQVSGNNNPLTFDEMVSSIPTSSAEDVTTEVTEYTSLLTDLETTIDNLPEAGSGGGAVETCTVTIDGSNALEEPCLFATTLNNGNITISYINAAGSVVNIPNVICNSIMNFSNTLGMPIKNFTTISGSAAFISEHDDMLMMSPTVAGENCTLTVSDF